MHVSSSAVWAKMAVISILKVYNSSLCHFCFGLETTLVEEFPIEPIVSFNSTRKAIMDKKEYGTFVRG